MKKTPGFDRNSCRLPIIRHAIWQGFGYPNLGGPAEPLNPRFGELGEQIKEYEPSSWVTAKRIRWGECRGMECSL